MKKIFYKLTHDYWVDYNPISGFWTEAVYNWKEQIFWNIGLGIIWGALYGSVLTFILTMLVKALSLLYDIPYITQIVYKIILFLNQQKRFNL